MPIRLSHLGSLLSTVVVVAFLPGCDAIEPSAPEDELTAYRKTLPPVPASLKPLADELEQLFKQQNRRPVSAKVGPIPRMALPGQLPYRMAEGGKMVEIDLSYTPASDEFLKKLANLPDLEKLDLTGTPVTDAGLDHLAKLPVLKHLTLLVSQVTPDEAAKFGQSHPDCKIYGPELNSN